MEEEEGGSVVASREEGVRPLDEAKQWLAMVFVDLLGKVVKVINGGDHSERKRKSREEGEDINHNNHSQKLTD